MWHDVHILHTESRGDAGLAFVGAGEEDLEGQAGKFYSAGASVTGEALALMQAACIASICVWV